MSKAKEATIRMMSIEDVTSVANIARSAMPYAWSEQVFHDCLKADYHAWILTREKNIAQEDIIGFGIILIQNDECQLMNICVKPDLQGQGFGSQMLQHIIDFCKARVVRSILLEVRKSNYAAISIYHAYGFVEMGERKYYYPAAAGREDAVILVLGLVE